jgi:hypothetical protein
MTKATLAWFAGISAALLIALLVIAGIQGQSSKVETQMDAHSASPTTTVER